jgi:hypothetical protein
MLDERDAGARDDTCPHCGVTDDDRPIAPHPGAADARPPLADGPRPTADGRTPTADVPRPTDVPHPADVPPPNAGGRRPPDDTAPTAGR